MRKKHEEGAPRAGGARRQRRRGRASSTPRCLEDDAALRPKSFDEYVGQSKVVDNLKVFVAAAQRRGEALDHVLFSGPPGIGKTTLAHLIAARARRAAARHRRACDRAQGHAGLVPDVAVASAASSSSTRCTACSRWSRSTSIRRWRTIRLEIPVGDGPNAEMLPHQAAAASRSWPRPRAPAFCRRRSSRASASCCASTTTRAAELTEIVRRSAGKLGVAIEPARRRGDRPPRARHAAHRQPSAQARARLRRGGGRRPRDPAGGGERADAPRRRRARARRARPHAAARIIQKFDGGPVGVESLAAACAEERDTLEDVVRAVPHPGGLPQRTPRGRVATRRAYEHLGLPPPRQGSLL